MGVVFSNMLGYKGIGLALFVVAATLASATASEERDPKLFPIFQVVKFGNNECNSGGTRNGTCYTQQECTAKGGTSSGSCASGYGVCCVMTMECGTTSNMNNTYLVQEAITDPTGKMPCTYKVCKCGDDICRIRLDFTSFSISGPSTVTTALAGASHGDCTTDSFTVTSPGNQMPPVICGQNTGQHMILDASDMCHELSFNLAGSQSRSWDIKVTQFTCGLSRVPTVVCNISWAQLEPSALSTGNLLEPPSVPAADICPIRTRPSASDKKPDIAPFAFTPSCPPPQLRRLLVLDYQELARPLSRYPVTLVPRTGSKFLAPKLSPSRPVP